MLATSVVLLLAPTVVDGVLIAQYVGLAFELSAQWQLPFYVFGIPAAAVAGAALALLRLSGHQRNRVLMTWAISATLVPVCLIALIRSDVIP